MSVLKKIARNFALPFAVKIRLDKVLMNRIKKNCCIINFHGVRKLNNNVFNNRHLPVTEFEKTIKYLIKNYNIVPLSEIFELHRKKTIPSKKTISLTFDDGYLNNFEIALPILKKYNVPATFYIITKSLSNSTYLAWPDMIDVFKKHHKEDVKVNNLVFNYPQFVNKELNLGLLDYLKTCGENTEILANKILDDYNYQKIEIKNSPELVRLINETDFEKYKNEPLIEFGSHTHTHFSLEYLNSEIASHELDLSKKILESKTNRKIISLAFPDGSYSKETLEISKKYGYTNLVAVYYYFDEQNNDPNLLSRYTISNSTTFESNVIRLAFEFDKFGFN